MAPKTRGSSRSAAGSKRKRTVKRPAREPTPSSDSSSSTSTPDASPVGSTPLVDHLASRVITTGRKVDFELFENEGLYVGRQLIEMGFEKMCSLDCPTYPSLVKEFYKNLTRGDDGLISNVRGKSLNVTTSILSRLLELPLSGPSSFNPEDRSPALSRLLNRDVEGFEEVSANQLPLGLRLLHNICSRVLFPKTGRFDFVSERDIFVMDAVVAGKPINLPRMIIWYMVDCGSKKKFSLPYGMVLTKIFQSQGIVFDDSEPMRTLRHTDYYTLATIHRMGFVKRDGMWERKTASEERAEAPGPSVHHASPELPPDFVMSDPVPDPAAAPAPTVTPAQVSTSSRFSDEQMSQLRELFAEFDNKRNEDINKIKEEVSNIKEDISKIRDEVSNFKEEIMSRLDVISFSLNDSVKTFSTELHKIFEHLDNVTDGSGKYAHATTQLRKDIELAVLQIANSINDFKKLQKEDFMEMIGHLKQIVFKHT